MSKNVCVIIGHGGNDCGAINPTTKETELGYNTDLADKVNLKPLVPPLRKRAHTLYKSYNPRT